MESCHTRVAIVSVIVSTLGHHASAYCSGSCFKSLIKNVIVSMFCSRTLATLDIFSRSDVDAEHMIQINNVWCECFYDIHVCLDNLDTYNSGSAIT